jgi:hypothetical protein
MKAFRIFVLLTTLTSLHAKAQFKYGYYYDNEGAKVVGLLRFNYGGNLFTDKSDGDCSVSYKPYDKGKKKTLTTSDISCFVIERDSFTTIRNFRLNALVTYPKDFAKVLASGRINLYMYYAVRQSGTTAYGGASTVEEWIIEKNGQLDKLTRKKFEELMPTYLSDYPDLLDQVNKNELKYRDIEKIVKLYNGYIKGKQAAD